MGDDPSPALVAALPEHIPAMLRVAGALVGTADAEDAAQEAIVRAWQALGELRDPAALRPWLLRITVNVCRQWRRGGFGRRQRLMEPLPDDDHPPWVPWRMIPAARTTRHGWICAPPSMPWTTTCASSWCCAITPRWMPPR